MPNFDHLYTMSANERDSAVQSNGYTDEGIACFVFDTGVTPGTMPLFRLYGTPVGKPNHLYTLSLDELNQAINHFGYKLENIACFVFPTNGQTSPLFRMSHPQTIDRLYTTSADELNSARSLGYNFDGIAGHVFGSQVSGTKPLFRLSLAKPS
jgi:hypothetical protein